MFQPKFFLMALVLLSMVSEPASAGSEVSDDVRKPDNMCRIVNQASINTRKTTIYRELVTFVDPNGLRTVDEARITTNGFFRKAAGQTKWTRHSGPIPAVTDYPRFTSCIYVDDIDGPHFRAHWHNRDPYQSALAEVWLSPDLKRMMKVIRRFPQDDYRFPSKTVLSTLDYDATRVVAPPSGDILP
ncbi:hypothetical protein [Rhizobium sp. BK068]|uniref:hypothetical protein n=1 Tax=Rhizobium sp. BK068 TaxID=2512130 RepID=UPI0010442F9D|nr:hypothetical protein [Rhizobium sp. BK068]TCM59876.1 hypothetical protein EV291_1731 [Rhizobium sp. BK068]